MFRLNDIQIRENISDEEVLEIALKKLKIPNNKISSWRIYKKSIDARNKNDVHFVYTIDIECSDTNITSKLAKVEDIILTFIN